MRFGAGMRVKEWAVRPQQDGIEELAARLRIPQFIAQVLLNRNISTEDKVQSFLSPKLADLIEPERMPGVVPAAKRIKAAIENGEKIAIYGDYDVDGITSTAILWHLLTMLGANTEYYIPHRIDEGYGLNEEAISQIAENGTNLIITVDCGVTAVTEAALAKELGMDIIITDHHKPGPDLPGAVAIVHPMLEGYANPDSAGAMVAFKVAWGLVNLCKTSAQTPPALRQFLLNATTLAAMGTVADVVDLRGENRILASYGLKALSESNMAGIKALIETASLTGKNLDSYHIGFHLAPMLNAAGRMGHARLAVEMLTSDSDIRCFEIAKYLQDQNRQRRKCQRDIFTQAKDMINHAGLNHPDRKTIVLAKENWHTGVIGIVASKVVDNYNRPAVMINTDSVPAQGSARSIAGFDMHSAFGACAEHLESFGGHAMAAGLRIRQEKLPDFIAAFENYANETLTEQCLISTLDIEGECRISDFTEATVNQLKRLEPFGQGNPAPIFATMNVHRIAPPRKVGAKGDHLQIAISDNTGAVRCIGFGMGKLEKKLLEVDHFSVAYEPQINTYNGNSSVQFVLKDIKFD